MKTQAIQSFNPEDDDSYSYEGEVNEFEEGMSFICHTLAEKYPEKAEEILALLNKKQ